MADLSVDVARLLASAVELTWPEAVALIQAMAAANTADPSSGRLHPDGRLLGPDAGKPATPAALAKLLQDLLPAPGASVEPRVPAALRYTLVRAVGGITAPPLVSVEEFSQNLSRFERGDRATLLQGVFARWKATSAAPVEPRSAGETSAPLPAWDNVPIAATPDDLAGQLWLRPQRGVPAAAHEATPGSVRRLRGSTSAHPAPSEVEGRGHGPAKRQPAGRLLTALAVVSILVAAGVVSAGFILTNDARRATVVETVGPHLAKVRDWAAAAAAGATDAIAAARRDQPADAAQPARDDRPAREAEAPRTAAPAAPPTARETDSQSTAPGSESERRADDTTTATGTVDLDARGTAGSAVEPAAPGASAPGEDAVLLPGQLVETLDVGQKPVFSPSFASDGSAIFFDQQATGGGSAIKEARPGSDKLLHVLSVVDDGAQNYHPQLSPDGATVAFDSDRDGVRGVYLSDRAGKNIRRVSGEGYAAVPKWSPDGQRLTFVKAEDDNARVWNVWTLDLGNGTLRRVTSHRVGQPWGASWLPDGRRICYSHEDRIVLLDLRTGATRVFPSPRKRTLVRTPAVSPDGHYAIFQLYRNGAWLLDLQDGSTRKVLDDPTAEEFSWSPDGKRVAFHSRRDKQWGIFVMSNTSTGN